MGTLSESLSPSQVRQADRLLAPVMSSAVDNDEFRSHPAGIRLPRLPEADPRIVTVAEVKRLAHACEAADRVQVLLLAYGALRMGEALALRRRHLDVAQGRVLVSGAVTLPGGPVIATPKNHPRRELVVSAFVARQLAEHLGDLPDGLDVFVFRGRRSHTVNRHRSYQGFRRRLVQAVADAGLADVIPHDLRSTYASWVADSHGVLVAARPRRRVAARRLGHANASVTTRHDARAMNDRAAQVAEHLDKLRTAKPSGTQRTRKPRKEG